MSEMRGGICFVLHADLRFGVTLEIVMLGFRASHRNLLHRRPPSTLLFTKENVSGTLSEAGQRSCLSFECSAANVPFALILYFSQEI